MRCPRCQGWCYRQPVTADGSCSTSIICLMTCINCGERTDARILANRLNRPILTRGQGARLLYAHNAQRL